MQTSGAAYSLADHAWIGKTKRPVKGRARINTDQLTDCPTKAEREGISGPGNLVRLMSGRGTTHIIKKAPVSPL